jgi:hypothetical protein
MDTWPAWCPRCDQFVEAELLRSPAEIDAEIRELESFAQYPGWIPEDRLVRVGRLPDLRRRLAWRTARRSPPRCLLCASDAVTPLWPEPGVDIPHLGRCEVAFKGWLDVTSTNRVPGHFSPEGIRLASAHQP